MNQTKSERPGVYSSYDLTGILQSSGSGKAVAIAALCSDAAACGTVRTMQKHGQAREYFGVGVLTDMITSALQNGAYQVHAIGVQEAQEYRAALEALTQVEGVGIVAIDSDETSVQQALRDVVLAASADRRECIGVCAGGESVSEAIAKANAINSERVVLVTATEGASGLLAAAMAGAMAGLQDASLPLGGANLLGALPESGTYSDNEVDALVKGGVTAVECRAGTYEIVRAVTTRSKIGDTEDSTWRELSTILIVDDVIPTVRSSLKARFHRSKNSEQTRAAIRSQVILELENKMAKEIIGGYSNVTVAAVEDHPTVCLVEFSFSVTHGLNQIWVSAHITV